MSTTPADPHELIAQLQTRLDRDGTGAIAMLHGTGIYAAQGFDEAARVELPRVNITNRDGSLRSTALLDADPDGQVLLHNADTPEARAARAAAEQRLHETLTEIGKDLPSTVEFDSTGDPSAFDHGHYSFSDVNDPRTAFYVTAEYFLDDPHDPIDGDPVPDVWTWHTEHYDPIADDYVRSEAHTVGQADIETVVDAARSWIKQADHTSIPARVREIGGELLNKTATIKQRLAAAGIEYPRRWDEMGSSEKDLWEERQITRLEHGPTASDLPAAPAPQPQTADRPVTRGIEL